MLEVNRKRTVAFEGLRVKCALNVTPGKGGQVSMGDIKRMSGWMHWSESQSLSIFDLRITSEGDNSATKPVPYTKDAPCAACVRETCRYTHPILLLPAFLRDFAKA